MSYTKFDGELDAPSGAAAGFVPFAGALDGEPPKKRTWGQAAADTGVQLAEGVNTIAGAVPSLVAPDSGVAGFWRDNAESWRAKQSDVLQGRANAASAAIDKAGEDGVISQVVEAAKQYSSDPALAARFVTTNLPSMIPGIGAAKLAQAAALARGASAVGAASLATTAAGGVNSVLNAGGARGEAFEDIKKTLESQGRSPEEATQIALDKSRLPAVVGGVTGFISGKTGLESALTGKLSGKVAAAATELFGEQLEEVAPKLATNYQASEYDNRSMSKDVGRTIVETAIGSGPGAIYSGMVSTPEPKTPQQAVADIAAAPDVDAAIAAASEAVNAGPKFDRIDFLVSLNEIKSKIKENSILQKLRDAGDAGTITTGDFLNALSVANNPVVRMDQRELARDQVSQIIEQLSSGTGFTMPGAQAEPAPVTSTALATQQGGELSAPIQGMQFDPNTIDGQSRFVDELPGQRAIGGPRALTGPIEAGPIENAPAQLTGTETRRQDPRLIPMSKRAQSYLDTLPSIGQELTTVVNQNVQNAAPGTTAQTQAAPVEAPAIAGTAAAPEGVSAAPGIANVETAGVVDANPVPDNKPAEPAHYGTGHRLLTEGGKPFKTERAAKDAKKLQPMMRVKKVTGGYVLTDKTPAQVAAQAKAAARLAAGTTGDAGIPQHAHGFMAREGGLSKSTMKELGFDKNQRVGSLWMFKADGGMSLEQATEKLIEGGYLKEGASHSDAIDLIKKSVANPQYTADGWDRIAQAEADARFEDHLAAQEEAALDEFFDPFAPLDGYELDDYAPAGYDDASDPVKMQAQALIEQTEALGIDADAIRELAYEDTKNESEQKYHESIIAHTQRAIESSAQVGSNEADRGQDSVQGREDAGSEGGGNGRSDNGEQGAAQDFLTSPTREDILAKQQAEEDAAKAKESADKAHDEADRAARIKKEIDVRQAASAENFTLGQSAEDALAGQGDIFSQPESDAETMSTSAPDKRSSLSNQVQKDAEPAAKATAILDAAEVKGKERIDILKDVKNGAITPEEVQAAYPAKEPAKPAIADFGEKIGGAKKDVWTGFKDKLNEVSDDEIASKKLSEVWPAPDYQALIDGGMDSVAVANIRTLRDEVPSKPRSAWKVSRWAEQVKELRGLANALMDGRMTGDQFKSEFSRAGSRAQGILGRSELYQEVGHGKSLEGIRLTHHFYNIYRGKENVSLWVVEQDAAATAFSNWPRELATGDTKQDAIDAFKARYSELDSLAAVKKSSFDIVSRDGKYWVAKKIGRNHADMAGPFSTVKEARDYRASNLPELEAKLEKYKQIPRERRDVNDPRVGEDMRNGQDVTPEFFAQTFGFRGVEFGNWVEQKRRQKDLNDAFDGLMDMAAVLGIPARAISLDGQLGLAFGARGSGGVNPAAAHYESDKVVINLTKKEGAGSLGHEWWHAVDNYFSKKRGKNEYMTTALDVSLASRDASYFPSPGVRKEMIDAFGAVVKAIRNTSIKMRSQNLDDKRGKAYWTTGEEMTARAFESYLIAKLQDQDASNDYLANVVDQKVWDAMAALGVENENSYHYPTADEIPAIRAGFDKFFDTVQTKEDEFGNVAMYSRGENNPENITKVLGEIRRMRESYRDSPGLFNDLVRLASKDYPGTDIDSLSDEQFAEYLVSHKQSHPMLSSLTKELVDAGWIKHNAQDTAEISQVQKWVDQLSAKWENGPSIRVVSSFNDLPVPSTSDTRGLYYRGTVYLVASRIGSKKAAGEVLAHESIAHFGLREMLGESDWYKFMRQMQTAIKSGNKPLNAIRDQIRSVYVDENGKPNLTEIQESDEIAAKAVEMAIDPKTGEFNPGFGFLKSVFAKVAQFLRDVGFDVKFTNLELQGALVNAMRNLEVGNRTHGGAVSPAVAAREDAQNPDIRFARGGFDSAMASRSPIQSNTWNSPSTSKFDNIVYTLQNKQIDTKRVVEAIKQAGKDVAESVDVYLREELFHGRSAKRTEDFLNNELTPLLNDMKARGISLDQIDKYLHARHAEEANKVIASRNPDMPDGGSGMKTQDAKDYLNSLGAAERNRLDAVAKKIDGMIATTRQLYADEGLESQETVDSWGAMFKHYVPLMREDKDGGMGIGQGFSIKGKESKGRVGSSRAVVDILANIAMQREKVIVRGEKNRVATALVGLATENPNPDFWTVGETPHEKVYDPKTNSVVDRIDPMYKSRENVVVAKVKQPDGNINEVAVVFNEDNDRAVRMAASLKNLDALQLNGLLGVSAKISRYISSINTQYNPIFGIVNLARDVQGAMVNLSTTELKGQQKEVSKHVLSALKGVYLDARAVREGKTASSKWAALNEEFQNLGGQTGYRDLFATSEDRAKALQNELMPYAWMDGTLGKIFTANGSLKVPMSVAQDKAKGLFDWLSDYNLAMENAVRLSAFKVGIDQGMSKERAASLAKNLTVNFNRKGQISQQAGALYAFFNAGVQGTARLSQVLFEMDGTDHRTIRLSATGKKVVAGGIMLGVAQAVMLAAAGFGDDDPPEFVRERNLIIPTGWTGATGDKAYITIPMPLGLHVLPNIGRVSTEFALGGFRDPVKRAAKLFGLFTDAFNPMGGGASLLQILSPTPIDPLVALAENKDGMGRTIAKTSRNPAVPGFTLAKDTASKPAKMIAEAINYLSGGTEYKAGVLSPTPDQVDFLIGQATGGVGREISKGLQTASAMYTGEELPTHKIPLVGRFYGDSDLQSAQSNAFYSAVKRIEEHELEIKGLRKDGKSAELAEYMAENPEARLVPMANRVEIQIQNLQKRKRELMKNDADAAQIKAVENQITERMKVFNMVVRNLREKQPA